VSPTRVEIDTLPDDPDPSGGHCAGRRDLGRYAARLLLSRRRQRGAFERARPGRQVAGGDDVLEVGAGPGLSTDVLRRRVPHLTAVELDDELAAKLAERLAGSNVEVAKAAATALPLESDRFSAATCFTMLHHVPTRGMQDQLLAELCRVLRPGGCSSAAIPLPAPTCASSTPATFTSDRPETLSESTGVGGLRRRHGRGRL